MRVIAAGAIVLLAGLSSAAASAQSASGSVPPEYRVSEDMKAKDPLSGDLADQRRLDAAIAQQRAVGGGAVAALSSDLTANAVVADKFGRPLGRIASVGGGSVVVAADGGSVAVPADAFGKNKRGLLLDLSKADFDRLAAAAK